MDASAALRLAIDLMHVPSRARLVREAPLPSGMGLLLQVAARVGDAERDAVELTGRPVETLREAATFFVEQVLFAPNTDCYRALGATREATTAEIRHNMALLLRWLHPDVAVDRDRSVFAARVALAWDTLKTPDRRAAYDQDLDAASAPSLTRKRRKPHRRIVSTAERPISTSSISPPRSNRAATSKEDFMALDGAHDAPDGHSVFAIPHAGRGWDAPEVRALPTVTGTDLPAGGIVHVDIGSGSAPLPVARSTGEDVAEPPAPSKRPAGILLRLVQRLRSTRP